MYQKLLFASVFAMLPALVQASGLPAYSFIHTGGTGVAFVLPDMGEIDFEVAAQDSDPALAVQVVSARVAEIRELMAGLEIASEHLEVRDIRKEMKKGDAATPVYDVRCGVKIAVKDLTRWKAVVAPLLDMPNLDGFMTFQDTSERARVETDLMSEAIAIARKRAQAIAAGFGRKLGPVNAVSSGELKNLARSMNLAQVENYQRARGREQTPSSELLTVNAFRMSQSVDVIFRIK